MIKALLFDYGGTLDAGANHWFYVIQAAYSACRLGIPEEVLREAYVFGERALERGRFIFPEDDFFVLLSKKMDLEMQYLEANDLLHFDNNAAREAKVRELAEFCDAYARRHTQESSEVLAHLGATHQLVLVSNFYGNLHSVLESYDLKRFFPTVIESAVVGVRKPNPRIWAMGVEAAGCLPEETLAIGDSFRKDVVPAADAGCRTVWFRGTEWCPRDYDDSVPDFIIYSLSELLSLPCLQG